MPVTFSGITFALNVLKAGQLLQKLKGALQTARWCLKPAANAKKGKSAENISSQISSEGSDRKFSSPAVFVYSAEKADAAL